MADPKRSAAAARKPYRYELTPLEAIAPYAHNPRTHSAEQIEQLRESIRAFGFTNPLLLDEQGTIIAGHGRFLAAQLEGMSHVPTILVEGLSESQMAALVVADNQLALKAGWDEPTLLAQLQALSAEELKLTAFDDADMSRLIATVQNLNASLAQQEWVGMPGFENEPIAFRSIIVHFKDAESVKLFEAAIAQEFTPESKSAWFPARARETNSDKAYISSESASA